MKKLHIGTSGWSYDHWKGVFYPYGVKADKFLEYYAEHFDCVELNSSFYRLPSHKTILDWRKRTPRDFIFCPKISRFITHQKKLNDVEKPFREFLERFRPLKKKVGPILVQLPGELSFRVPDVENFLSLAGRFRSWNFAIEARNETWMAEKAINLLSEKKILWVIADSGGDYPSLEAVTCDAVYLRFHGPSGTYSSKYSHKELGRFAQKAKQWMAEGKEIWAFFNNDFKGYAVENAMEFREIMAN